jgi:hypothetical protein
VHSVANGITLARKQLETCDFQVLIGSNNFIWNYEENGTAPKFEVT